MKRQSNRWLLVVACGIMFFLGFETAGFQLVLLRVTKEFAINAGMMGVLVAAQYMAIMVMPLFFGRLSDYVGKKRMLAVFLPLFAAGCLAAASSQTATVFALSVFVIGTGYSVCECVASAALVDSCPEKADRWLNLTQCMFSIGAVISPLLTEYLMGKWGISWRVVFGMAGTGALLFCLPLMVSTFRQVRQKLEQPQPYRGKARIFTPYLFTLVATMMIYVGLETGAAYFIELFFAQTLHADGVGAYGLSAFWLAMASARLLFSMVPSNSGRVAQGFLWLAAGFLLLLSLCQTVPPALVICAGFGIACGPVWPMLVAMGAERCPDATGAVSSLLMVGGGLGGALAPSLMGLVAAQSGIRSSLICLAVAGLLGGLFLFCARRKFRD